MLYNHDWWFDGGYDEHVAEARRRCALNRFPELAREKAEEDEAFRTFHEGVESRTVVYLRDGFSYEVRECVPRKNTTTLTFECMPAEDAYRVGCFVVTVPFDDIVRVEVYAVHKSEKPEDMPAIKGFAGGQPPPGPPPKRPDDRTARRDREPAEAASKAPPATKGP